MMLVDHIAATLARLGISHVFGVGGANIEDLFAALDRQGSLQLILAKHEFSAGTMADGYARASGRPGVVITTSGGGAMNLVPALAESYASCVPVLAIVGEPPTSLAGRGAFQDSTGSAGTIDAERVFSAVSVHCTRISSAAQLPGALEASLRAATGDRPGPAVLLVPKDLQTSEVVPKAERSSAPLHKLDLDALRRAVATLRSCVGRTLIIAGEGVGRHEARDDLAYLADVLDAQVAVTPEARDAFDNDSPRFVGVTGTMGHRQVAEALAGACCCLLVGTRLPALARQGLESNLERCQTLAIHFERPFVPALWVRGHVRRTLRAIRLVLGPAGGPAPKPLARSNRQSEAMAAIADAIEHGANLVIDAGNTGATAVHDLSSPSGGRCLVALGMGGMGYSFGAAMGAACATGRRSYVVAGDGSFWMHGLEIHTALEHCLAVTFLVLDNSSHGMCSTRDRLLAGGDGARYRFRRSHVARGLGAMLPGLPAFECDNPQQLREALRACSQLDGPAVISLATDVEELPPFEFSPIQTRPEPAELKLAL
ncbi:MAG: thiamine pyrophosphate-binding protein [Deltaproteobacteria bacterium]|nr:thiamine pyrophosphate-binding protein [Deltaproteobacteria bacterium]